MLLDGGEDKERRRCSLPPRFLCSGDRRESNQHTHLCYVTLPSPHSGQSLPFIHSFLHRQVITCEAEMLNLVLGLHGARRWGSQREGPGRPPAGLHHLLCTSPWGCRSSRCSSPCGDVITPSGPLSARHALRRWWLDKG